jgi:sigma-E factor negative regulatory protein RseC
MRAQPVCSKATVLRNEGALTRVVVARHAMCEGCQQEGACNIALMEPGKDAEALVRNPLGARPGDVVEISMSERALIRGGAMLYLLPLVLMLAAIVLAVKFKSVLAPGLGDDILALLAALAGLALSVPVVRIWSKRSKYLADNTPVITSIISESD